MKVRFSLTAASAVVFCLFMFANTAVAQPPVFGNYANQNAFEGDNFTVTPTGAPTGAVRIMARTPSPFRGMVEVDPASGVVRVTNARPAGTFTVKLTGVASDMSRSSTTFTITVRAEKGCSPFTTANFTGSSTYSTGAATETPQFGLIADFNKDGNQDFVAGVFTGDKVSVFIGDGSGGFAPVLNLPVTATQTPQFPAVADFNGDGNADIAVTNVNGDNVSVWLGTGTGTFGSRTDFPALDAPRNLVVGDFNNDGIPDLATVGSGTSLNVAVLIGTGTGTFAAPALTAIAGAGFPLVVGHFNADANEDLVTATTTSLKLLAGNGTGGFTVTTIGTLASNTEWAEVADFNNDGNLDVSIDNIAVSNDMNIFLGNGMGTFANAPGSPFTVPGAGTFGHGVGDMDGDGVQDVAIASLTANNYEFYRGTGTGAMTSFGTLTFTGPRGVSFGDLNGDGRQDAVFIERSAGRIAPRNGTCAVDVTTSSLPAGTQNTAYPATQVAVSGGTGPYTYSGSGFPSGVSISASGLITGTPTVAGTFFPKISVTDSSATPVTTFRVIPMTVSAVTANVSVSGRVTDSAGISGVPRAIVIMTGPGGFNRRVFTSPFGYFRFDDVPTGQTYTVSVASKIFTFTPQMVLVNADVTNLNFAANP